MQSTDTRVEAQAKTSKPVTLTADEAIARLNTWQESPPDDISDAVIEAALAWSDDRRAAHEDALETAVEAWKAAGVERVQTASGSFGCACNADDIRSELRASKMIVEVEGHTMGGVMLLSRGCRIAYLDIDGRWRGVGSIERADLCAELGCTPEELALGFELGDAPGSDADPSRAADS